MALKTSFVTLFLCALSVLVVADKDCRSCERSECPNLTVCPFGVSLDGCGCCEICSNGIGDKCDTPSKKFVNGPCGEYLQCAESGINEGTCVCIEDEAVCGSDDKTYSSICELLNANTDDDTLTLHERSPCRLGPKIKSAPQDAIRPIGSILLLDCEATGFPVPTITWELNKEDGSTTLLPNDDSLVAVQVRGGPEKHMVTGWIQIIQILPENVGRYTCIATNSKGEVRASAKVSFKDRNDSDNEL